MHITILYATYSNSTYAAAEVLNEELVELGHEVSVSLVNTATAETLTNTDLTIFTSPSWDYDGKEGQPHEDFFAFFKRIETNPPAGFSYTIMALGDSNYTYFCGAADEIAALATAASGNQTLEPLKLDQYYLNEPAREQEIRTWAKEVSIAISQ